jgi:integrase/recombinase XerD
MTTPAWIGAKQRFKQYLQLERSLSLNSVEAYIADLDKFELWSIAQGWSGPLDMDQQRIQKFPEWVFRPRLRPESSVGFVLFINFW